MLWIGKVGVLAALCLSAPLVDGQQIYQCGNTFQDKPCSGMANEKPVGDFKPDPVDNDAVKQRVEQLNADLMQSQRIRTAMEQKAVVMGMNRNQVRYSFGSPSSINHSAGGQEQWCWHYRGGAMQCVYFTNGKVTYWN